MHLTMAHGRKPLVFATCVGHHPLSVITQSGFLITAEPAAKQAPLLIAGQSWPFSGEKPTHNSSGLYKCSQAKA